MNIINSILLLIIIALMVRSGNIKVIPGIEIEGKLTVEFQDGGDRSSSSVDAPGIAID